MAGIEPKLIGGRNWTLWKHDIKIILKEEGLLGIVEGVQVKPGPTPSWCRGDEFQFHQIKIYQYHEKENLAKLILLDSVSNNIAMWLLNNCASSRSIWLKLKAEFDEKQPGDRRNFLLKRLIEYPKFDTCKDIKNQYYKIKWLWNELYYEDSKLNNVQLPDYLFLNRLSYCLPDEFDEIKNEWLRIPSTRKIDFNAIRIKIVNDWEGLYETESRTKRNQSSRNKRSRRRTTRSNKQDDNCDDCQNINSEDEFENLKHDDRFLCLWCVSKKHLTSDCPFINAQKAYDGTFLTYVKQLFGWLHFGQ